MTRESHDFMLRCIDLALLGSGKTSPNPLVGAVLVYDNKIIGEGFHKAFGENHAEVNAINQAIENGHVSLLEKSTLFVNLEPCSHVGKTGPCCDLIIKHKIPHVVIGIRDPFPEVNGKGITRLRAAGIRVDEGLEKEKCEFANRRFITYHVKKRPFVLLKFAQTVNHLIASPDKTKRKISNSKTDVLVHKWRSEESAIMAGTNTIRTDNPQLNVRNWVGKNPVRVTLDKNNSLPKNLYIFDGTSPTLVFTEQSGGTKEGIEYVNIEFNEHFLSQLMDTLYARNILSVMVEGGPNLLNQFIKADLWDEARIITSDISWKEGVPAPMVHGNRISEVMLSGDRIEQVIPFSI